MTATLLAAVVLAGALVTGCTATAQPGPSPAATAPAGALASTRAPRHITTHQVPQARSDPGAGGPGYPSLALVGPAGDWNGKLVVFLAGTGDEPSCCRQFLAQAVVLGFHAISLGYDNATPVATRCSDNLSCYGAVHENVFTGADPSHLSSMPPRGGVEHRLVALLSFLRRRYPDEGWGKFLVADRADYGSIVLAGHSQGGAEVAFIATQRRVAGVVMLSSPPDTDGRLRPASWLAHVPAGKTPIARYFGFANRADPFFGRIATDWRVMGLDALGSPVSVDQPGAHSALAHELISTAAVPATGRAAAHNATADDGAQPLCRDGVSRYAPAWRYLLQAAGGFRVSPLAAACASSPAP